MNTDNNMKKLSMITTAICLLPLIAGAILYKQLPDTMAIHWDFQGEPNGWQSKFFAAIVMPGILAILNLLAPFILKMDPKYDNMEGKVKSLILWIIPCISILCSSTTLAEGLGYDTKIEVLAPCFVGLLFIIIGNYMPKMSQTYTVGIKLPWTLANEENWDKTHRMAGFLWVAGGFLIILIPLFHGNIYLLFVIIAAMVLVPTFYSYNLYRKSTMEK